jgi:hypothetical protein
VATGPGLLHVGLELSSMAKFLLVAGKAWEGICATETVCKGLMRRGSWVWWGARRSLVKGSGCGGCIGIVKARR